MARDTPRPGGYARGYGPKWMAARAAFLALHRWCVLCQHRGLQVPATRGDHVVPHRGDMKLFWNRGNWQALCQPCHDGAKQAAEHSGFLRGCDAQGVPLDPQLRQRWLP